MNQTALEALPARWELLTPHRDRVVASLRRKYVDFTEAEDVVHEAMLRLVQWDRLDADHAGGALMTVAQRVAVDGHRRSGRERKAVARFRVYEGQGQQADEIALDRLEARHLAHVAATLSWRERRALEGRAAGMLPRETAASAGMPARSVHLALSRARATLRAAAAGSWMVLLEWLRRHPVHRLVQPATMAAAGAVLVVNIAGSAPRAVPATGGTNAPHSSVATPARVAVAPRHALSAPPGAGVPAAAQIAAAPVVSPSLPGLGSKVNQAGQLLSPITSLIPATPLAPVVVSAAEGALAHAQALLKALATLPPVAAASNLLPPLSLLPPHH